MYERPPGRTESSGHQVEPNPLECAIVSIDLFTVVSNYNNLTKRWKINTTQYPTDNTHPSREYHRQGQRKKKNAKMTDARDVNRRAPTVSSVMTTDLIVFRY
jgi:hypothetical protein